jgi:hypothetical protein
MRKWRRRGTDQEGLTESAEGAAGSSQDGDAGSARAGSDGAGSDGAGSAGAGSAGGSEGREPEPRANGPWDISEKPVDRDDPARLHFGALSVLRHPDLKLHFQVDQGSGEVTAVMFVTGDGAMELHLYAAPRHEDLWDEFRARFADEATKRGGRAGEVAGPFGPALQMVLPVTNPEGEQVAQPSTILGVSGPRWLLRATMFGRPATEFRSDGLLETILLNTVVDRGTAPMAPGDTVPLTMPAGARRVEPPL